MILEFKLLVFAFNTKLKGNVMATVQKGMNVEYLGHLGKVLVIDEQEQYALVETYNGHEQYAVPMEELEEIEAQLPLSLEASRY
ncbi:Malate dehydrogenase [Vibrio chagasii]|nr:Malate dehydrogenase [Vibrio chagasii]CAH6860260.1 Malate dehydrogenase [Vibrio chagasii]CAH6869695.1 Malate dehydrogenase [Vibrio chagasii]CAH6873627.1 Malate dehydrogenase [Vibrio chagasii]CAH6874038.1 Malate dehydrogenase [Vibrio chagasii]